MSLPRLKPILGDRRDVRASLQFAEQNLLKQKSFIEADLKKRQVELQRNERILKKSFGNLGKTSRPTANLGVVQTNRKDIRGGHEAADESNRNVKLNRDHDALPAGASRRLGRRHSVHSSDTLTHSELSRLGIGPSAPTRAAGRKHGRRGSVDANIPASRPGGTPSVGVETHTIDESSLTKQSDDGGQTIKDNSEMLSKHTNVNLIRDSRERNAVFVFKYEEEDSTVPAVQSCFATDKAKETNRENDVIQPAKPKSALSRSRSLRKKLRVKIMSPVQEHNQSAVLAADLDGQLDSGISEESENSSCGTRSLYSDSYDSLSHASESDRYQEESSVNTGHQGSHQGKLSIDVNSNHLLKPLKNNRGAAASEKIQSLARVDNDSPALRTSDVASEETRGPTKASVTRRRMSIAAAEGISLYRQDKSTAHCLTKRYSDTLLDYTESSPLGSQSSDFPGRRGSTSIVGDSLARDTVDARPTLLASGRQEGIRQSLPASTKVKAHHKPAPESNHYVQKTIERTAAWEAVRRTRYLPGYEPNAH